MQKSIRNVFFVILACGVGYWFYSYFYGEVKPSAIRRFYKIKDVGSIEKAEFEEKSVKAIDPAKNKDADLSRDREIFSKLNEEFALLAQDDAKCKAIAEETLKDQEIIDPNAGIFKSKEDTITALEKVLSTLSNRPRTSRALQEMVSAYNRIDSISSEIFFNNLNKLMICRKNRLPIFLDTLAEAVEEKVFSEDVVEKIKSILILYATTASNSDHLSDNILYSLNLIRITGVISGESVSNAVSGELDGIYTRLAQFEDNFYDLGSEKVIRNPVAKIDEYNNELEYISEEVTLIMRKYFEKYMQ